MPAGSAYDPAGKAGLATFAGAMMDEGAGDLDSKAFHEALANRAISFSARADRDYLVISITTLKENAPEALHLLQLALTRPRFDNEPLTRVRTQIIQSLQQDQVEPQRVAARAFIARLFRRSCLCPSRLGRDRHRRVHHRGGPAQLRPHAIGPNTA